MTNPEFNYRFTERSKKRSSYENFVAALEYLTGVQDENRRKRRCIVRIVTAKGTNGSITAAAGWEIYCRTDPLKKQRQIARPIND